jgi:hypothetical protein
MKNRYLEVLNVSIHNVRYLGCCKNFKFSNTLVYCGLKFLSALISNIMIQPLNIMDRLNS